MEIKKMLHNNDVQKLIENEGLIKHEEGGYFKVTYTSPNVIEVSAPYEGKERLESTKINYLLDQDDFSGWHRIKSDETWRFKNGASLTLLVINKENGKLVSIKIGDPLVEPDAVTEYTVTKWQWFSAFVNDKKSYAYVECEVRPGFDYRDWQLAKKEFLIKQYPQYTDLIVKYSRDEALAQNNTANEVEPVRFSK